MLNTCLEFKRVEMQTRKKVTLSLALRKLFRL